MSHGAEDDKGANDDNGQRNPEAFDLRFRDLTFVGVQAAPHVGNGE